MLAAYAGESPVLDIGSPKLITILLAERSGAQIVASDIAPYVGVECASLRPARGAIHPLIFDARAIPLRDASIPFISCVSTIEHIGSEGDSKAVREMVRVLRIGGTLVLTVPLVPAYHEHWSHADPYGKQARDATGRVFFSRYYDWKSFTDRIVVPSGLQVSAASAWEETQQGWYKRYCDRIAQPASLRAALNKWLDVYWARSRIHALPEGPTGLVRHGLLAIVLRKQ